MRRGKRRRRRRHRRERLLLVRRFRHEPFERIGFDERFQKPLGNEAAFAVGVDGVPPSIADFLRDDTQHLTGAGRQFVRMIRLKIVDDAK